MQRLRMVAVTRVGDTFHARVLAARLGSEGIVVQLRGGGLEGPYPVGDIEVLVDAADLGTARELLLADEVESAFSGVGDGLAVVDASRPDEGGGGRRGVPAGWVAVATVVALVLFAYVSTLALGGAGPGSGQEGGERGLVEAPEGPPLLAPR